MKLEITKDSIDLGLVTTDVEPMLKFYRDTLGFELEGELELPGGVKMTRLICGTSIVKLVVMAKEPAGRPAPGGLAGGTGYRYWTISCSNLEDMVSTCRDAGYQIPVPPTEIRPGVSIAMLEDPDGNWVELLQMG
ncbi:MAG: VOC family protein [Gammaproteobacteria bacterium]|nr:VOC family protein [Gammaproteobacteria bacterium]